MRRFSSAPPPSASPQLPRHVLLSLPLCRRCHGACHSSSRAPNTAPVTGDTFKRALSGRRLKTSDKAAKLFWQEGEEEKVGGGRPASRWRAPPRTNHHQQKGC
ncbi:unnamed protein product [Boreogadus saida]